MDLDGGLADQLKSFLKNNNPHFLLILTCCKYGVGWPGILTSIEYHISMTIGLIENINIIKGHSFNHHNWLKIGGQGKVLEL